MPALPSPARPAACQMPLLPASLSATVAPAPARAHIAAMHVLLTLLLVFALLGVLCVLGLGVAQLVRGGDPRRSNKLMQMRVILQAVALLILALLWMLSGH
jgi:Hypoxia induced protein conserved region